MMRLLLELRRRSVFRVAGGYGVMAWLLIQLSMALETTLLLPSWFDSIITVLLILGFPVAILLAWAFEMTPEGFRRTQPDPEVEAKHHFQLRIADGVIAAALVALVVISLFNARSGSSEVRLADALPAPERSIAVLPFSDMSGEEQAYFSDGVAEEILSALDRIPELKVAGRTSAFAFRNRGATLKTIGEELDVGHILEGSVRKSGERVRITARLVEARSGTNLWSETYDDELRHVFDLQDRIARDVARELRLVLDIGGGERLAARLTDDQLAYDLFLRGREMVYEPWGIETLPRAVEHLQAAVARDPDFAEAWKMLSAANFLLPTYSRVDDQAPYIAASEEAARRAVALQPTDPGAQGQIAQIRMSENKFAEALRIDELVAILGPDDPETSYSRGYRKSVVGLNEDALPLLDQALADSPNNVTWLTAKAVALFNTGAHAEALDTATRALDQGFGGAAFVIGDIMLAQGRRQDAYAFMQGAYDRISYISPEFADPALWELAARALYLRDESAIGSVRQLVTAQVANPEQPLNTSLLNALLSIGEAEAFMNALEAEPFANGTYVLSRIWDDRPAAAAVRTHPDFPAWAERIGLVAAWQESGWPDKCAPMEGTDGTSGRFTCT